MGEQAGDDEPASLRRALARELTTARNRAEISQARLAEAIGYPPGTIAAAESGDADVDRAFWIAADQALVNGGLTALHDQIRQAEDPGLADMPASTISGVMTDLASIRRQLPAGSDRIHGIAGMLDQLSRELAEAAHALRQG